MLFIAIVPMLTWLFKKVGHTHGVNPFPLNFWYPKWHIFGGKKPNVFIKPQHTLIVWGERAPLDNFTCLCILKGPCGLSKTFVSKNLPNDVWGKYSIFYTVKKCWITICQLTICRKRCFNNANVILTTCNDRQYWRDGRAKVCEQRFASDPRPRGRPRFANRDFFAESSANRESAKRTSANRYPSHRSWLIPFLHFSSLEAMKSHAVTNSVTQIAMPKIGCGLDLLKWDRVFPMIKDIFKYTNISIQIYYLEWNVHLHFRKHEIHAVHLIFSKKFYHQLKQML